MSEQPLDPPWWRELELEVDHGLRWVLGTFELAIFRRAGEWLLSSREADFEEPAVEIAKVEPVSLASVELENVMRFVAAASANRVRLLPRVADRSVVARPHAPIRLLPKEETRIHVSSPVWVELIVGQPMHPLCEMPVRRLSDTWFGPNTRDGDVAYALKTQARVRLDELPRRSYRLITAISISNEGADPLLVDRINIPVPRLSVYAAADRSLWSDSVSLVRSAGAELATVRVGRGAPREAGSAELLSEPRVTMDPSFLARAFTTILSPFQED